MAWQEVTPIPKSVSTAARRGVKFSMSARQGATVSMSPVIYAQLGWSKAASCKLFLGGGESEGKLRLIADTQGTVKARMLSKGGAALCLMRVPGLAEGVMKSQAVPFVIDGEALVITLPAGALLAKGSPSVPARNPFTTGGGKVDVTSRVLGRDGGGGR